MPVKNIFIIPVLLITFAFAQDPPKDTTWTTGGGGNLNFSQVGLNNWAAGGQNTVSILGVGQVYANYLKGDKTWDNSIKASYGVQKLEDADFQKNEDRVDLLTQAGLKAYKKFYYSALLNLKTQFSPTFSEEGKLQSTFFAPAFLLASVGMQWKPKNWLTFYLSPSTGKFTFVMQQSLADAGAFGVEPAELDTAGKVIVPGENLRAEFGAYFSARMNKEVMKNVTLTSNLELFNNFTDPNKPNRKNIDVNWETQVNLKVNKWLSAGIFTHLIYDNDILIAMDTDDDGIDDKSAPAVQFKEVIGIGLSFQFGEKDE